VDVQESQAAPLLPERLRLQPAALRTVAYAFLAQSLVLRLEPAVAPEVQMVAAQESLLVVARELP
jgi:hypothetical protein